MFYKHLLLTLYIVYISFYVVRTDMSENKLFVIVIVIVIIRELDCVPK